MGGTLPSDHLNGSSAQRAALWIADPLSRDTPLAGERRLNPVVVSLYSSTTTNVDTTQDRHEQSQNAAGGLRFGLGG